MFSFSNNFLNDEKGVEGAKIIKVTSLFNNKIKGQHKFYLQSQSDTEFFHKKVFTKIIF